MRVAPRHPQVHENHVGGENGPLLDCVLAAARLADDLDVVVGRQERAQAAAEHLMVVNDENPDRFRHRL